MTPVAMQALGTLALGVLLWIIFKHLSTSWARARKLPPGPLMSLPVVGENLELLWYGNFARFMFRRFKAYGNVFAVNIFGLGTQYVVHSKGMHRAILAGQGMSHALPIASMNTLLGQFYNQQEDSLSFKPFRRHHTNAMTMEKISGSMPYINAIVQQFADSWVEAGEIFDCEKQTLEMGMIFALDVVVGLPMTIVPRPQLLRLALAVQSGCLAAPINLPGTPFHNAMKHRAAYRAALREEVLQRLANGGGHPRDPSGSGVDIIRAVIDEFRETDKPLPFGSEASAMMASSRARIPGNDDEVSERAAALEPYVEDFVLRAQEAVMGASHTTAYQTNSLLTLLALRPDVQEKIREEQRQLVATHGPAITLSMLSAAKYLDAAVREACRIFPSPQGVWRRVLEDTPVEQYVIPKGSLVLWAFTMTHITDPKLFDGKTSGVLPTHLDLNNLDTSYRPELWLDEETKPQLVSFGGGIHMCAGMNLALAEMKAVVAHLTRRVSWRLLNKQPVKLVGFPNPHIKGGPARMALTPIAQPIPYQAS